jgi:hypothetical protein
MCFFEYACGLAPVFRGRPEDLGPGEASVQLLLPVCPMSAKPLI